MNDLIKIEKQIQLYWKQNQSTSSNLDYEKKKCFVTFPFPYQNGTLHLGHAYTISKVEFYARFKKMQGFNVLFPYGFHCTGMPIVASALKLKESLDSRDINNVDINSLQTGDQLAILHSMKITMEEIPTFVDPLIWSKYFPARSIIDLQNFGAHIDYRRSFITTSANVHYDVFVKWQFENLNKKGYLKFAKRPVIYSVKDGQICGDHDRSKGEGVRITKHNVYVAHGSIFNLIVIADADSSETSCSFEYDQKIYISSLIFFHNFKHQTDKLIKFIKVMRTTELENEEFDFNGTKISIRTKISSANVTCESEFVYYEPSDTVISRTGDVCVVAIIDHWYIEYSDPVLKKKIIDYVESDNFQSSIEKQIFMAAINNIDDHACSKTGNIPGTQLLNTNYIIDSLSDSTIYMAYYTIAHKIINLSIELIKTYYLDIYEFIFMNGDMPEIGHATLLQEMKNEFLYWYPVDVRVSGEDLINNHVIMCLCNHAMIWNDNKMLPKRFNVNGYITLDGRRMSKSEGVFMTLADAIEKYGADATRMTLASAGSGMNDANFSEENIQLTISRLLKEKKWCENIIDKLLLHKIVMVNTEWNNKLKTCVLEITHYYEEMEYQKVIDTVFNKLLIIRDDYVRECDEISFYYEFIEYFLLMIYPICPHIVEHIWIYGDMLAFKKIDKKNC